MTSDWRYLKDGKWIPDGSLKVEGSIWIQNKHYYVYGAPSVGEPWYPLTVEVISSAKAKEKQACRMGSYTKEDNLYQYGRPVFKQENGENYLYADGKNISWFAVLIGSH